MKQLFLSTASAICALAISGGAAAQDEERLGEVQLAQLDEITVFATRNPLPAFDFPGQVSVVDKAEIDDFNPSSLSDIFTAVPGAGVQGGPRRSGETPAVRGLSGEGVLVLLDGVRQSFVSGHDGRFFVDPDLVQALEVVRGPTSALYGSGALGGVIAIRTVTADDLLEDGQSAYVKIGGGFQSVNDEWRASALGAWASDDGKLDIVANLTYRNSDDIELGNGLDLPSEDENLSSLLKASYKLSDALTWSTSWTRFGGDSIDPNNPQGNNVAGRGNENVFRDIKTNTLQTGLRYAPGSDLIDANLVGYFANTTVEEDVVDTDRVVSRDVETFGFALDNRSKLAFTGGEVTFTYGGEYYQDEQTGRDNTTADGTRGGVPDATSKFYGLFAQAELTLNEPLGAPGELTIIPGVRWDRFENDADDGPSTDDSAVSPKVGVSYKPIKEIIIFGNWAEAFRAPSFNELYADGVHFQLPIFTTFPPSFAANLFIPNLDLMPEQSQTWEVGAGLDLDNVVFASDRFTVKASYYSSDVENLIDLDVNIPAGCFGAPFPPCGSGAPFGNTSQNVNVTNAEIDGVEVEADYDSDHFYARAAYSTIDGTDVDNGDFVGVLAPDVFFLDAGVKIPRTDIRLGGRVTVAGAFDKVNTPTDARAAYKVGDVYAVWQPSGGPLEGLRIDLGVDNVGDTDYQVVAAGVSEPGVNYKASISWSRGF